MNWHNFKTGQTEFHEGNPPVEKLKDFLPQIPPLLGMFDCYIAMGKTPMEAFVICSEKMLKTA